RILGLHQALGDAGAHAGHRHALLGAVAPGLAHAGVARVVDQVFLGDRATAAGALDLRRVDAFLVGGEAGARRQRVRLAARLRRRRGLGCLRLLLFLLAAFGAGFLLAGLVTRLGDGAFLDDRQHLLAG